jgi:hypothetical protein
MDLFSQFRCTVILSVYPVILSAAKNLPAHLQRSNCLIVLSEAKNLPILPATLCNLTQAGADE